MPVTIGQVRAFVKEHALSGVETDRLSAQARSAEYWTTLCPDMTVGLDRIVPVGGSAEDAELAAALADYAQYGHCAVHGVFAIDRIERIRRAALAVQAAGWPLIFVFVYDELWTLTRAPQLDAFLRATMGPGYQTTVSIWVNYVPAVRGGSGFPPHMDDVRPGHHSATCWIPLSPATPDNGCVYVLEKIPTDPDSLAPLMGEAPMPVAQVSRALTHVRALPAAPGMFLAWPEDTVHWGGRFLRGDEARLAVSLHLTSADFENVDPALRLALLPERPLPLLDDRLRWISNSLLRFRRREATLERFVPLAERLSAV
jgi:hypothetical protein